MPFWIRKAFPYFAAVLGLSAIAWAVSFGRLPKADFTFNNGTEIQTVDPPKATGVPEGRIIDAVFEGLMRDLPVEGALPDDSGIVPMKPQYAMASSHTVSDDGKTYTFTIRDGANWTNGEPVTSHDFVWSWQRMLHPETGSQYAYQLYYIVGAKNYNLAKMEIGDDVEVELADREDEIEPFPRGTMLNGVLKAIDAPPELPEDASDDEKTDREERIVYTVTTEDGETENYALKPEKAMESFSGNVEKCFQVLPDFEKTVGLEAPDDRTLVVKLNNSTPYFLHLVAFYPMHPVNRTCIEEHGSPDWTKPENIVSNGPFRLQFRRIRDRVRLIRNEEYWNVESVNLKTVDALTVENATTSLNMYLNDQLDWTTLVPNSIVPELMERDDFIAAPMLSTYFYRINVTRPPFNNKELVDIGDGEMVAKGVLVRRALNAAINKQDICTYVTKSGQQPALSLTPPGVDGYKLPACGEYNVEEAKRLLALAGYPQGRGIPKLEVLYNTSDAHREIAEVIQRQWAEALGVRVSLRNTEWASYLDLVHKLDFTIARAGWIGDYPDPNTFVDMFVTGGENNQTGWSNEKYDALVKQASEESDPSKRLELLAEAESILVDELPILPIYYYVSNNMVKPRVKGFGATLQDLHPLTKIEVTDD